MIVVNLKNGTISKCSADQSYFTQDYYVTCFELKHVRIQNTKRDEYIKINEMKMSSWRVDIVC